MSMDTYSTFESLKCWAQSVEMATSQNHVRMESLERQIAAQNATLGLMQAAMYDMKKTMEWIRMHYPDIIETYKTVCAVEDRLGGSDETA